MKAHPLYEVVPIIKDLIYRNKVETIVKMAFGKYETYYYDIDENRLLQVYSKTNDEKSVNNPKLIGLQTFNKDGRLICRWVDGQPFAFFMEEKIDSNKMIRELYQMLDDKANQVLTVGIAIGMNKMKGVKKTLFEDPTLLALGVVFIALVALIFLSYTGFSELGVSFG